MGNVTNLVKDGNDDWIPMRTNASFFTPSSYSADLTMDATGEAIAIAADAEKIHIVNRGVTTEDLRVAFGTSEANALANLTIVAGAATTGYYMPSNVDVPGGGIAILGVPANATYIAAGPGTLGDVHAVSITQGI